MTTATEPDPAAHRDRLDETAALFDALSEVAALIRARTWGEAEVDRFLARFAGRPAVHEHLSHFVGRVRGGACPIHTRRSAL